MRYIRYIKKTVTKSVQFHPKHLINHDLVQCVKTGAPFRYLGGHFDFEMSNNEHKTELIALVTNTMSQIDYLPLHPKNKILLYNRKPGSKKTSIQLLLNTCANGLICQFVQPLAIYFSHKTGLV